MLLCDLDSVQSQANRMEAAFTAALAEVVPHHVVEAGGRRVELLDLPHRIADAAIRTTGLGAHIRTCFESIESGDAVAMARIAPTSLVYGAWDSRDTRIRVPRAVRSEIRAFDVSVLTRSVRYSGAFGHPSAPRRRRERSHDRDAGSHPTATQSHRTSRSRLAAASRVAVIAHVVECLARLVNHGLHCSVATKRSYLLRCASVVVPRTFGGRRSCPSARRGGD